VGVTSAGASLGEDSPEALPASVRGGVAEETAGGSRWRRFTASKPIRLCILQRTPCLRRDRQAKPWTCWNSDSGSCLHRNRDDFAWPRRRLSAVRTRGPVRRSWPAVPAVPGDATPLVGLPRRWRRLRQRPAEATATRQAEAAGARPEADHQVATTSPAGSGSEAIGKATYGISHEQIRIPETDSLCSRNAKDLPTYLSRRSRQTIARPFTYRDRR
jgi:hypothetical protein